MTPATVARGELPPRRVSIVGVVALASITAACFGPGLVGGRQFAFRDAAYFYYPLHLRVQQEWSAGRLPLWEPSENGGGPLLGNPVAAVLYPGKLLYAILPYAWAARLYVIAHTLLAFFAMRLLLRSWTVSAVGSAIGALCYAFAGPILFLYCNVIYLVGAAWAPLGLRAADRWLRLGRRSAVIELALVLAMEALGGDIQSAYVTGLCAGGLAILLALCEGERARDRGRQYVIAAVVTLAVWAITGAILGSNITALRSRWGQGFLLTSWLVAGVVVVFRGRAHGGGRPLGAMLLGLLTAAVLAFALGAVQLCPVAETLAASVRWDESSPQDIQDFSLEPYRVVEWFWPNVFGHLSEGNRFWLPALPPVGRHRDWIPSLYLGLLPLVLAFGAVGVRGDRPGRAWLSSIVIIGFVASCGRYADPFSWFGWDGDGSLYQLLATLLPGFGAFRFPSKLMVFVCLALAGLAGIGWDDISAWRVRRAIWLAIGLLGASLVLLIGALIARAPIVAALAASAPGQSGSFFGPFDAPGAWRGLCVALGHGAVAAAASLFVVRSARSRAGWAGALGIALVAADLAIANAGLIVTLPQDEFDRAPQALAIIQAAERDQPSIGPFRIHRLPASAPPAWNRTPSTDRARDLMIWHRDSLIPGWGIPQGATFTHVEISALEPEQFSRLFRSYIQRVDARTAANIGATPGQRVLCYSRQSFDLWGTRYFILPIDPGDWQQPNRAFISFLADTEQVYPRPRSQQGATASDPAEPTRRLEDVQIRRNTAAFRARGLSMMAY